jgi:FKBP-type peptidyl-prolyl cis-trans isomerase
MDFREQAIIESWVSEESDFELDDSGIYIKLIEEGSGDSVAVDREVVLSYKAYFYNGELFDDTQNWKDTFNYVVGVPNQVISGISEGIDGLRGGGKAKIIIPSRFAFGKDGSSTGLVPPFEPLKYEIKIIDVKVN